ncbi:putative Rho-type GTPase-activating protein 2 [Podospora conica]|nr:putative Rho-type GTPase-activating protein 2 [Schizothecium conicum]
MGRKPVPQALALPNPMRPDEGPRVAGETDPKAASPLSPRSPFRPGQTSQSQTTTESAAGPQALQATDASQQQPQLQHQRQIPRPEKSPVDASPSALTSPAHHQPSHSRSQVPTQQQHQHQHQQRRGHNRRDEDKASKSSFFFNFGKSSKSTDRLNTYPSTDPRRETTSRDSSKQSDSSYPDLSGQRSAPLPPSRSELSLSSSTDYDNAGGPSKRSKPKPFTLLKRTRSIKDGSADSPSPKDPSPAHLRALTEPDQGYTSTALRTAPIQAQDRSFREMMSSAARNHSAERPQGRDISGSSRRDTDNTSRYAPSAYRENGGSFFSGLKGLKASVNKNLFGSGGRNDHNVHREPVVDDEHYVLKVINLPLVEQTRKTRISKRLEDSRDKTEFWMPAFPWRAIDYLNYKGSDVEGLYRVPGSGPQIKRWQRKFDEELDVDLFEQHDLYDINIIGSMLKAWLRELPDELFPKAAQDRIARECAGSDKVPQLLIDELSNLSPFNYYLLFAITCHLSLLLAHSDKNKMDFRNLCICFQPCMKIDAFCFKFLVCDWRDCWKGCASEAKYIEEEYALFDVPPPKTIPEPQTESRNQPLAESRNQPPPESRKQPQTDSRKQPQTESRKQPQTERKHGNGNVTKEEVVEERAPSSSSSGKTSNRSASGGSGDPKTRLKKKPVPEIETTEPNSTVSTTLTIRDEREGQPRGSGDLRPLSPIKPLSPMGF